MSVKDDEFDYEDTFLVNCPHCGGIGSVPCHCGGDLCICDNDGERPCYVCGGEGEVTEARYDRYEDNQRKNNEALRAMLDKSERSK